MIVLRRMTEADSDMVLCWRNLEAVSQHMYTDRIIDRAEHEHWISLTLVSDKHIYWIIEHRGEPVGVANVTGIDREQGRCSWAFYLASDSVRGTGIGSSVEVFVLDKVFRELGLRKLCCEVLERNEAVWKMHGKFGFAHEGLLRDHVVKDGKPLNVVVLGMLAAEWEQARDKFIEKLSSRNLIAVEQD